MSRYGICIYHVLGWHAVINIRLFILNLNHETFRELEKVVQVKDPHHGLSRELYEEMRLQVSENIDEMKEEGARMFAVHPDRYIDDEDALRVCAIAFYYNEDDEYEDDEDLDEEEDSTPNDHPFAYLDAESGDTGDFYGIVFKDN